MTSAEFRTAALAQLQRGPGWQTAIAHQLGVAPRTVRRWLKLNRVPEWVPEKLKEEQMFYVTRLFKDVNGKTSNDPPVKFTSEKLARQSAQELADELLPLCMWNVVSVRRGTKVIAEYRADGDARAHGDAVQVFEFS